MRWAVAVLLAVVLIVVGVHFYRHGGCYHVASTRSDGPFAVAIKPFPVPLLPLANGEPAKDKPGGAATTVRLTNTSASVVSVQSSVSGYLIDHHGYAVTAWPDAVTDVGHPLVPLRPGHSRTLLVGVDMEGCGFRLRHSVSAGDYRMRLRVLYVVAKAPRATLTIPGHPLKTVDSTTTVPVVLR